MSDNLHVIYPKGETWDNVADLDAALCNKINQSLAGRESVTVLHRNEAATIYHWIDSKEHFVLVAMADGGYPLKMAAIVGEEIQTLRDLRATIERDGGSDFSLIDWLIDNLPVGEQRTHANN